MFQELKILKQHGIQYVPDLRKVELTGLFRGRPVIDKDITSEEEDLLIDICPSAAFCKEPFSLNMGKCVFCKACAFALPDRIKFTNDYKIASNTLEGLIVVKGKDKPVELEESLIRPELRRLFKHSLKLREVSAGGDNSCEMELNAAGNVNFDMGRYGFEFVASPRHADGVVITGPITENMAEALDICYHSIPKPKLVILAGTDAISGGMFHNSEALNRVFIDRYPVDLYIPGNPCHPLTFVNGLMDLVGIE